MAAAAAEAWPPGSGWVVEPKFDGWRACMFRLSDRVYLQSRTGRDLSRHFPEIVAAVSGWRPGTVVDGELVAFDGQRVDFALLQRRVARADPVHPAHLICFDLLEHPAAGIILHLPLAERRAHLQQLLLDADPLMTLCPQSDSFDQGEEWLHHWAPAGIEGAVAKRANGLYRPGRRDWIKRRARHTVDLILAGLTGHPDRPRALLLAELDHGRLAYRGSTLPLSPRKAAELGRLLAPLVAPLSASPWPNPLPARWANLTGGRPVDYTPIHPVLVVEVDADTAFEHGRYRHALRYRRIRADLL
jgi:ATP-dependent DNA ligase